MRPVENGSELAMKPIFVMVKCEPGTAYDVAARALDTIEEVGELYSISGQYDLLVKCNLASETDVGRFVTSRLQTLPNVKDTLTIITFNAFT
jgi:DNA-binding Lrp family transcriptional regulator